MIVVAHPDDETLWAGGTVLMNPGIEWTIIAMCRASDYDRAPKFARALSELRVVGAMADLDDGPDQRPLNLASVERTILGLLQDRHSYDLIITHSPFGEYTRHRRHEETGRAVATMWRNGRLRAPQLWLFAYEDRRRAHAPFAIAAAHRRVVLSREIWSRKHRIITELYGFPPGGFEERTTPKIEAFWCFREKEELDRWIEKAGRKGP